MKRVLCIVSAMNTGGAETFLMKIYRNIDRSKYQMDFCVNIINEGYYDKEILELGGRIFNIPSKSSDLNAFKTKLSKIVKENHYEYVLRITSNTMGFMDLKIAKKAGARVCAARSSNSNDAEGIKARLAHIIGRLLYSRFVDVKIAPSDLAARYTFGTNAYEKGEVIILHNAVDTNVYRYDENKRLRIRKELGITDKYVIGHIGRFSKQKNHQLLIEIFNSFCKYRSDAVLLLVGEGELETTVRNHVEELGISDKVLFLGIRQDIPAILSSMDFFVLPSLYEGMPNVVIEAQSTGLPCLISDTITQEANISNEVLYCSLDKSPNEWAKIILENMVYKRKADNTYLYEKGYDIESVVRKFEDIIFCR